MEEEKKKGKIVLLIVFLIFIIIGTILYNNKSKDNYKELEGTNESKYILLNDYSRFFTVNSCVYKYIQYLQKKDTANLIKVLDDSFITNNNISDNNIYNLLPDLSDGNYSFVSKKIYYNKESENFYKYYVYGYTLKETLDSSGEKKYYTYEVNFDIKNQTFSIAPYVGDLFKEEKNG